MPCAIVAMSTYQPHANSILYNSGSVIGGRVQERSKQELADRFVEAAECLNHRGFGLRQEGR